MRSGPTVAAVAAMLACCGCSMNDIAARLAPADVQEASKKAVADLEAQRFDVLERQVVDEQKGPHLESAFLKMAAAFPNEQPKSVSIIGFTSFAGNKGSHVEISYEYQFSNIWVVAQFSWVRVDGALRISGFKVTDHAQSYADENAFTFRGKSLLHYLVFASGVFATVLSLVALIKCIWTKGLKRKWLWIIFILFGMGSFVLNWGTGEWHVNLVSLQLLSFTATQYSGPWVLGVSVPVGAVVFLGTMRRRAAAGGEGAALPNLG